MGKSNKRKLEVAVISDVHLGTYGCHANELLRYLKSIKPETLILNGDIIDIWQFSKRYWPKNHMKVIKQLSAMMAKGVQIYYVTGNHDEMMRKFVGFKLGSFKIVNKLVLNLDGKKAWVFHGDVFDVSMQHSKWLTKLGSVGYDLLILLNRVINFFSEKMGKGKISLSKTIKDLKYLEVIDFLHAAEIINNCKVFIGNQSMNFAIAEQLKSNRILEMYFGCPNVIPCGGKAYDVFNQNGFEYALNQFLK
jgi:UDP-2,3-diacylglucosamine pyrophosphatase LpxH